MFRNLFFAALAAALCAGLLVSAIQHFRVTPLILHAETFEGEAGHSHGAGADAHDHEAEVEAGEWAPQDGAERTAYTVLANLLAAAGFALLIGGVSALANLPIDTRTGWVWGAAGFAAFVLAPAYGLTPELPGMPAADLFARQLWWIGTALATGAAILLLARTRAPWAVAVAVALVAIPHIVGAPAAPDEPSAVPAHLAAEFAAAAIGTSAVFWLVLGTVFGGVNTYLAARPAASVNGVKA